jgi:paraquat-inducible protein B
MSKQANPTKVGAFVLIGLAILVFAVGLLGASNWFSRKVRMVTYFDGSVNGLVVGSPVKFKGVTVGQVIDITLTVFAPDRALIPVVIEIDESSFHQVGDGKSIAHGIQLDRAIKNGLRASLEMESIVTGRLYVSLDMYPDAGAPTLKGEGAGELPEIPTRTTGLEKLFKSLQDVDVAAIGRQLNEILDKLNNALAELNVRELNDKVSQLLESADKLVSSPKIAATVDSFKGTADKATEVLDRLEKEIPPLSEGLRETTGAATETLGEVKVAVSDLRRVLAAESPVMSELTRALGDLSDAARSLRLLSDELARDPSVILKGRYRPE